MSEYQTQRVQFSVCGVHRGKSKRCELAIRQFLKRFQMPHEDTNLTFGQYLKLKKTAGLKTDDGRPTQAAKDANDRLNAAKNIAGSFVAGQFSDGTRKKSSLSFRSMVCLDIDECSIEQAEAIWEGRAPISKYASFYYTTRSHRPKVPKFRLVLFLTENIDDPVKFEALTRFVSLLLDEDPDKGLAMADAVSFRWNQIMYMPSISVNQPYKFGENDGEVLDPDEFLADYDWENIAAWPVKETEHGRIGVHGTKMEDPREKEGLIGAFCRVYDVEDAIQEFIPEIYSESIDQSSSRPRYDYVPGSGHSGCEVYEDGLFFQSYHSTDPAEGQTNAWDLVRIHKFGHLDDDAHPNTSPGNMPSFKAMTAMAKGIEAVQVEVNSHLAAAFDDVDDEDFDDDDEDDVPAPTPALRQAMQAHSAEVEARRDDFDLSLDDDDDDEFDLSLDDDEFDLSLDDDEFDLSLDDDEPDDPASKFDDDDSEPEAKPSKKSKKAEREEARKRLATGLIRKANGDMEPTLHNLTLICENDPRISGCVGWNEFTRHPVAFKPVRSKSMTLTSEPVPARPGYREWRDSDDRAIQRICSAPEDATYAGHGCEFGTEKVMTAVATASQSRRFNPVKDEMEANHAMYVESGRKTKGSIERLAIDFLGCPDDPFHRESARLLMIAMVARVFEPGHKFDCVAIIRGAQGGGKGYFWKILSNGYFSELGKQFDRTDRMVESMQGCLINEMGEMAGLNAKTSEDAKEFITRTHDKIRLAYAHRADIYPRQGILTGTSNRSEVLYDPTGNRRFWLWFDIHDESNPIDLERLRELRPWLWGEAVDEYKAWRKRVPIEHGDLRLDLSTPEQRAIRDQLAESVRARKQHEEIAELVADWLTRDHDAGEVLFDESRFSPMEHGFEDEQRVYPSMVCPEMAYLAMYRSPLTAAYRTADTRAYGRALKVLVDRGLIIPAAEAPDGRVRVRRHSHRDAWYIRAGQEDGPLWIEATDLDDDEDDLDGLL